MTKQHGFLVYPASALLVGSLGLAISARQKPTARAMSAAPAANAVVVYKSPT